MGTRGDLTVAEMPARQVWKSKVKKGHRCGTSLCQGVEPEGAERVDAGKVWSRACRRGARGRGEVSGGQMVEELVDRARRWPSSPGVSRGRLGRIWVYKGLLWQPCGAQTEAGPGRRRV